MVNRGLLVSRPALCTWWLRGRRYLLIHLRLISEGRMKRPPRNASSNR